MTDQGFWGEKFPYRGPTNVQLGLIRGSGTWGVNLQDAGEPDVSVLWEGKIQTPYPRNAPGPEQLSPVMQHLRIGRHEVVSFVSHGWQPDRDPVITQGTRKIFWVFRKAGVRWIVGGGTCGLLNNAIWVGDLIVPHDFVDLTTKRVIGLPGTELEFPIFRYLQRMAQPICPNIAYTIEKAATGLSFGRVHGYSREMISVITEGPHFETRALIQEIRRYGDTVNMSLSVEAHMARTCAMHIAFVHYGVNAGEGLLPHLEWELDATHEQLRTDMAKLHLRALRAIPLDHNCGCLQYRKERPAWFASGVE